MGLVRGVTKETFTKLAKNFMTVNDDQGFAVCPKDWVLDKEPVPATRREWNAWYAYRVKKRLGVGFMSDRADQGKPWSVPSLWPHQFDAEQNVQDDYHAADAGLARRK